MILYNNDVPILSLCSCLQRLENIFDDRCSTGKCVCLLVVFHSCIQDFLSKDIDIATFSRIVSFTFDNRNASKEGEREGEIAEPKTQSADLHEQKEAKAQTGAIQRSSR